MHSDGNARFARRPSASGDVTAAYLASSTAACLASSTAVCLASSTADSAELLPATSTFLNIKCTITNGGGTKLKSIVIQHSSLENTDLTASMQLVTDRNELH